MLSSAFYVKFAKSCYNCCAVYTHETLLVDVNTHAWGSCIYQSRLLDTSDTEDRPNLHWHHILLYGPTVSSTTVDPISQVCSSAVLVFPTAGNKLQFKSIIQGIMSISDFIKICPVVLKLNFRYEQMDRQM
jgi:hypothetical protein